MFFRLVWLLLPMVAGVDIGSLVTGCTPDTCFTDSGCGVGQFESEKAKCNSLAVLHKDQITLVRRNSGKEENQLVIVGFSLLPTATHHAVLIACNFSPSKQVKAFVACTTDADDENKYHNAQTLKIADVFSIQDGDFLSCTLHFDETHIPKRFCDFEIKWEERVKYGSVFVASQTNELGLFTPQTQLTKTSFSTARHLKLIPEPPLPEDPRTIPPPPGPQMHRVKGLLESASKAPPRTPLHTLFLLLLIQ